MRPFARPTAPWTIGALLLTLLAWSAAPAAAVPQYTPAPGDLLHSATSGQPGAQWAGGQLDFDAGSGLLTMTAGLSNVNYFNPANGSCATDSGSNCNVNFGPDLDITLQAEYVGLDVANLGAGIFEVRALFGSTGTGDILVTDPADGNSVQLEADWQAGTFSGTPTQGLAASVHYDSGSGTVVGGTAGVTAIGFLEVDMGSPFASLFAPDFFGLNFGSLDNFDDGIGGDLDAIVADAIANGELGDFSADANGQVFRIPAGNFVPEPTIGALLGLGLGGLVVAGRKRR